MLTFPETLNQAHAGHATWPSRVAVSSASPPVHGPRWVWKFTKLEHLGILLLPAELFQQGIRLTNTAQLLYCQVSTPSTREIAEKNVNVSSVLLDDHKQPSGVAIC